LLQEIQLVPISRKDCILWDVASSETVFSSSEALFGGGRGRAVLTDDFLGWRPIRTLFDWFSFPKEFFVIPLDSIIHVGVQVSQWGLMKTLRIHYQISIGETEVLEMNVSYLHRWLNALRSLHIPLSGDEAARLTSVKDLVNNYGWCFWAGFLAFAWIASCILWQRFHPNRNNFDFLMISFATLSLIHMFVWIGIYWKSLTKSRW